MTLTVNACFNKKRSKKLAIQDYKCAFGYCIDHTKNQPNGNKLCMNNYASKELALENCEKYKKEPNESNKNLIKTSLSKAFSLIDKAVKKNVLHRNTGANKKSKINKFVKTFLTAK